MGNNDSLPPPPPPPPPPPRPDQPNVPPIPAPSPGPAPQFPSTQPVPPVQPVQPVQGYPATQAYPQQMPPAAPEEPKKNNLPWIIAGAVAAIAVVVGAVLVFGGDDDDDTSTLGSDDTELTVPATVLPTVEPEPEETEVDTDDTFVITAPETTQPAATVPPGGDGVISVTDDTGSFSVFFPDTFQTDTAPIDAQGVQFAQVSGSDDLQAYVNDHDTFGITVLGAPADQVATPLELIAILDPGPEVCTTRVPQSGYVTSLGTAEVLLLDGCGTGGASAKVIMAVPVPDQNAMVVAVAQGAGPANSALLEFTQAVIESVTPV